MFGSDRTHLTKDSKLSTYVKEQLKQALIADSRVSISASENSDLEQIIATVIDMSESEVKIISDSRILPLLSSPVVSASIGGFLDRGGKISAQVDSEDERDELVRLLGKTPEKIVLIIDENDTGIGALVGDSKHAFIETDDDSGSMITFFNDPQLSESVLSTAEPFALAG